MKNRITALMISFLALSTSCSSSKDIQEAELDKGVYKVVITQTGDLSDFTITSVVAGGNSINKGVIDILTNEDKGMAYYLKDEENYQSYYGYKTTEDGVWILCTIVLDGGDAEATKKMVVKGEVFLNSKLLGTKEEAYNGGVNTPLTFSIQSIDF